jgi:hypothetical protein
MSQGCLTETKHVTARHLQLAGCWALFAVHAVGWNILERKRKQFKLSTRASNFYVTF